MWRRALPPEAASRARVGAGDPAIPRHCQRAWDRGGLHFFAPRPIFHSPRSRLPPDPADEPAQLGRRAQAIHGRVGAGQCRVGESRVTCVWQGRQSSTTSSSSPPCERGKQWCRVRFSGSQARPQRAQGTGLEFRGEMTASSRPLALSTAICAIGRPGEVRFPRHRGKARRSRGHAGPVANPGFMRGGKRDPACRLPAWGLGRKGGRHHIMPHFNARRTRTCPVRSLAIGLCREPPCCADVPVPWT